MVNNQKEAKAQKAIMREWDSQHSWHPFTPMCDYLNSNPLDIVSGEGVWLYDVEGRRYLDCNASNWTNVHGHNNVELNLAIEEQLKKVSQLSYKDQNSYPVTLLCKELLKDAPGNLSRVFTTDNGSCAIEAAVKMSFQYWQMNGFPEKTKGVGLVGGYHGDTLGAMSVGNSNFHERFRQWCFPCFHIPAPSCKEYGGKVYEESERDSLEALERILERDGKEIAFMIMEPSVMGPLCMKLHPHGFLKKVSALCKGYDVHLILDEIFVGLGRLGNMYVATEENTEPDFICVSKGLTGGYLPLAATLTTETIYEAFVGAFAEHRTFYHGHTFTANPLICALANKNMTMLREKIASKCLEKSILCLERCVNEYLIGSSFVLEVRQRGLACAIDLKYKNTEKNKGERFAHNVTMFLRDRGLLMRGVANKLLVVPPLVMSEGEMQWMFQKLIEGLDEYYKEI